MCAAPRDPVYLNAASHGLPDRTVHERVLAYTKREAAAGAIRAAAEAADEIASIRCKAAAFIASQPDEIAFTTTTTLGWGMAVGSLPLTGKRMLVAPHEWASNIAALRRFANTRAMTLEPLPVTPEGDVDLNALRARLDDDVAGLCVPMVSSLTGRRYPVEAIGKLPRAGSCFYIVDAAQALGQMPVDVRAIGCDILAATARKWLRGPRGTALLYVSRETLARLNPVPYPDTAHLIGQPESGNFRDSETAARFESFDFYVPLRLALGAAIDAANASSLAGIAKKIEALASHARARAGQAGLTLHGPAEVQSGITSVLLPAGKKAEVEKALGAALVTVKFPDFANEPLSPLPESQALLRVAPHVYNSRDQIDALFDALTECL